MTGPLRQCGRADCRLCNRDVPHAEAEEGFAEALIGVATLILLVAFFFVLIPVLVR